MPASQVTIHTDGGCRGNPGPGAWAAVLQSGSKEKLKQKELSGSELATTNNRMELRAAIESLRALKVPCSVDLHTDSNYLKDGITKWIHGWKKKGWKTSKREPVKNADLWQALDAATQPHQITWHWLKGHADHPLNERCDQLANEAMDQLIKSHTKSAQKQALHDFLQNRALPQPRRSQ